jgi:hypothetical protein
MLLRAAERDEMSTPDQVERIAREMLDDPRARTAFDEFLTQWMRLDRVLSATRDRRRYRDFNGDLAAAMVEETRRLFAHLVWNDENFMQFFSADYTFVNSDLARLYGLPEPSDEFARVQYPADSGRAGVLGHGSFLLGTSKPSETSPTARGLFVRNQFLGHDVPPPPAGLNTMLPEITVDNPMTNRQRLAVHLNSEACASCHRLIDPIGFGLEQYNAIGGFQQRMTIRSGRRGEGNALELDLDTAAQIQGIEDSAFTSPKELGAILAGNEACQRNVVKQMFRYAFGRAETAEDQPTIDLVLARFRDSGFRFRELVVAVVTSPQFLQKGP